MQVGQRKERSASASARASAHARDSKERGVRPQAAVRQESLACSPQTRESVARASRPRWGHLIPACLRQVEPELLPSRRSPMMGTRRPWHQRTTACSRRCCRAHPLMLTLRHHLQHSSPHRRSPLPYRVHHRSLLPLTYLVSDGVHHHLVHQQEVLQQLLSKPPQHQSPLSLTYLVVSDGVHHRLVHQQEVLEQLLSKPPQHQSPRSSKYGLVHPPQPLWHHHHHPHLCQRMLKRHLCHLHRLCQTQIGYSLTAGTGLASLELTLQHQAIRYAELAIKRLHSNQFVFNITL